MSPIYFTLDREQIDEICSLVEEDMVDHLGYRPMVRDISQNGEPCRFQIGKMVESHYTDLVQNLFTERINIRLREVAKIFGEGCSADDHLRDK